MNTRVKVMITFPGGKPKQGMISLHDNVLRALTVGWRRYALPRRVDPAIYQHFLRLNSRRRTQGSGEFRAAGYPRSGIMHRDVDEVLAWCDLNIGRHRYWFEHLGVEIWFAAREHHVLYEMTWG